MTRVEKALERAKKAFDKARVQYVIAIQDAYPHEAAVRCSVGRAVFVGTVEGRGREPGYLFVVNEKTGKRRHVHVGSMVRL